MDQKPHKTPTQGRIMRFHVFFLIVAGLAILYYTLDASGVFEIIVGDKVTISDSATVIKNAGVNP